MSCYIKRSDFFEEAKKNEAVRNCSAGIIDVCNIVISTPSADVVPVVRCEDCKLHGNCITEDGFVFSGIKADNAFCCVGKRKGTDNG